MIDLHDDQAAGLRRLFRKAPPTVVALYATGHQASVHALDTALRLAGRSRNVMVLDEAQGEFSLADRVGGRAAEDLLHALDGRIEPDALRLRLGDGVHHVSIAAAALAMPWLDETRRVGMLRLVAELQRTATFMLVHAREAAEPSPFVYAAPRRLLVAEASGRGAKEAYGIIKRLAAAGAGSMHVAVCRARDREDAHAFFQRLEDLTRRHVGVPLAWLGEVERDDLAAGLSQPATQHSPREAEAAFLRRLAAWGERLGHDRTSGRAFG